MLPKLVRDKIPEIISRDNKTPVYKHADEILYKKLVLEKMCEELLEFEEEPCLEEAADIFEVFLSILKAHGLSLEEVEKAAIEKRNARGSFYKGIILENII